MEALSMHKRFRGGFLLIVAAAVAIEIATMGVVIVGSQTPVSADKSISRLVVKAHEGFTGPGQQSKLRLPVRSATVNVSIASQSCLPSRQMIERLQTEQKATGGKLVLLSDGLQQSFSDVWRRKAHVEPVRVSSVVAHLFPDETGTEWNADVVEFDAKGCAMSRTFVPGEVWNALLRIAVGIQV
jgi:hypothetical protein